MMTGAESANLYELGKKPRGLQNFKDLLEQAKREYGLKKTFKNGALHRDEFVTRRRLGEDTQGGEQDKARLTEVTSRLFSLRGEVTFYPDKDLQHLSTDQTSKRSENRDSWGILPYMNRLLQKPATGIREILSDVDQPYRESLLKGESELSRALLTSLQNLARVYKEIADNMDLDAKKNKRPIAFRWNTVGDPTLDQHSLHAELFSTFVMGNLTGILDRCAPDSPFTPVIAECINHLTRLLPDKNPELVINNAAQQAIQRAIRTASRPPNNEQPTAQLLLEAIVRPNMAPRFTDFLASEVVPGYLHAQKDSSSPTRMVPELEVPVDLEN